MRFEKSRIVFLEEWSPSCENRNPPIEDYSMLKLVEIRKIN